MRQHGTRLKRLHHNVSFFKVLIWIQLLFISRPRHDGIDLVLCFASSSSNDNYLSSKPPTSFDILLREKNKYQNSGWRPIGRSSVHSNRLSSSSKKSENSDFDSDDQKAHESLPSNVAPAWPCGDDLDKRLLKVVLPIMANNAINPLMGAVDFFWVSQMGNALAIAGQSSANQVVNSIFWLVTFLPNVSATLVSKENASGNKEGVEKAVCQALLIGIVLAMIPTALILLDPGRFLAAVLPNAHSPVIQYARPCLLIRAFAFVPSIISSAGFAAFRGTLDTVQPVKISLFANALNAILCPIFIFSFGLGVPGAALATLSAEIVSAVAYLYFLRKRGLIRLSKIFRIPEWTRLQPLIKGGSALQLRNIALNITLLSVARVTNTIDSTGVAAAAHALTLQIFQLGGIALLALSTAAQTVVPNDLTVRYDPTTKIRTGGKLTAQGSVNRLMRWGFILGAFLGSLQLILLPVMQKSTPLQEVRDAATIPAIMCSTFQIINGLVFIGEGVMIGTGSFMQLSLFTVISTIGCLWTLRAFPPSYGLAGVWMSFGVFNILRLAGVWIHQNLSGPLAEKQLKRA